MKELYAKMMVDQGKPPEFKGQMDLLNTSMQTRFPQFFKENKERLGVDQSQYKYNSRQFMKSSTDQGK
jgi:hypothetical protein